MLACLHTFFATSAVCGVFENYVFVPQKTDLADHLLRTGAYAVPTGFAVAGVRPNMACVGFLESLAYSVVQFRSFVAIHSVRQLKTGAARAPHQFPVLSMLT
jgi:hypothetical protein